MCTKYVDWPFQEPAFPHQLIVIYAPLLSFDLELFSNPVQPHLFLFEILEQINQ